MELWIGALNLGLLYAFTAMGVFITFRIHNFPDITVDGSFVTGAAVTAVLIVAGVNPFLALVLSFSAGALAGMITAAIHTRFNIDGLLAGILVMTGLYSVNLHIMGRSNIPLLSEPGVIAFLKGCNPGLPVELWLAAVFSAALLLFWLAIAAFLRTDFGVTMRAVGNNPAMAGASGVNVNAMKMWGIALANGLAGLSGSLVAQYQGFADIGMGIGSIVFGLAAVIVGESIVRTASVYGKTLAVIVGSIVFRLMVALALYVGLDPIDLKLVTACFVLVILVAPKIFEQGKSGAGQGSGLFRKGVPVRKAVVALALAACVAAGSAGAYRLYASRLSPHSGIIRIGVVQLVDHGLLNITRDAFLEEMKRLGYENGKNVVIDVANANGDAATVSSILDKFLHDRVDIVVPISTGCTQPAINKIKHIPIVFATVANPFIIGAGKTDTDHLSNVTGVYGATPVDKLLGLARSFVPGRIKIGTIWDPSQENSALQMKKLKDLLSKTPDVAFAGATISNSSEVYQAALTVVNKGIHAFVLIPDHLVFSAFESVVKAADSRRIPIFLSDVERLKDGALATYGFDIAQSGIQAARMVDRIMRGEKPAQIPFERYSKVTIGVNLTVAKKLNIPVPPDIMARATVVYGKEPGERGRQEERRR